MKKITITSKLYRFDNNETVHYDHIKSKRIKTSEIIVEGGKILIRTPYDKPISEIENLIKKKRNWILKKQSEFLEIKRKTEIIKPTFHDDSTLPYLGRNVKLHLIYNYDNQDRIEFSKNQFFVHINLRRIRNKYNHDKYQTMIENKIESLYEDWLKNRSKNIFRNKVIEYSKTLRVNPKKIVVKNLRNRWGSLSNNKTLNLNLKLMKTPEHVIDYIIIHELCHFKIKGHSHRFWSYLHRYVPNYQDKIDWLAINGSNILS